MFSNTTQAGGLKGLNNLTEVCKFTKIWEVVVDIIKKWYTVDRKLLT